MEKVYFCLFYYLQKYIKIDHKRDKSTLFNRGVTIHSAYHLIRFDTDFTIMMIFKNMKLTLEWQIFPRTLKMLSNIYSTFKF